MTEFERLRINAGVTIVQLAKDADVSRGTIEKIEKDIPVRPVLAARVCNALSHYLPEPVTYESLRIKVI